MFECVERRGGEREAGARRKSVAAGAVGDRRENLQAFMSQTRAEGICIHYAYLTVDHDGADVYQKFRFIFRELSELDIRCGLRLVRAGVDARSVADSLRVSCRSIFASTSGEGSAAGRACFHFAGSGNVLAFRIGRR